MEINGAPARAADLTSLALYNYGCYTTMRVASGRARGLAHHLERLDHDAGVIWGNGVDRERIRDLIRHALRDCREPVVVRVTLISNEFDFNHPVGDVVPDVLVSTRPTPSDALPPVRLRSTAFGRDMPSVKHVGLFGALYERRRAQRTGFDDALFVTIDGEVCEGPTWNIAFFDGDKVVWAASPALAGVTMQLFERALPSAAVSSVKRVVNLAEARDMHGAAITNSGVGVRPVSAIDHLEYATDLDAFRVLQAVYESVPEEAI